MKVNELSGLQTSEKPIKQKLHLKLREIFKIVEEYEKSGEIRNEDIAQMDAFKNFVDHLVKKNENRI